EIVRARLLAGVRRGGNGRQPSPQAASSELQREGARNRESEKDCTGFDDSFDGSGAHAGLSIDTYVRSRRWILSGQPPPWPPP
ncbi:MAG TPA: hypothetical protein VGH87_26165, partial [Polyangiaceae bacterium]